MKYSLIKGTVTSRSREAFCLSWREESCLMMAMFTFHLGYWLVIIAGIKGNVDGLSDY